jgi:hypothetical protein
VEGGSGVGAAGVKGGSANGVVGGRLVALLAGWVGTEGVVRRLRPVPHPHGGFGSAEPAPLPAEVATVYDAIFEQFDADHSNAVDRDEMRRCAGTSLANQAAAVGGRKVVPGLPPPVLPWPSTNRRSSRGARGGGQRKGMAPWDAAAADATRRSLCARPTARRRGIAADRWGPRENRGPG